ncbi:hypothetical protein P1P91_13670 [Halomonas piscis]|uniref:Uncharacterized protein n=1 Tax=Halomonas piscis TaxID=3031727 RepID=A0ABY9YZ18_9GAMM|nr:hypothetical protein [Halomonas piscis]WNK19857.1 hypothetical protein P1P91_13670 [Halomonas piscis]
MAFSETIMKRRQWHSLESAAQFLSIGIGEDVSVDQLIELARSGDIPIFVDLSMPAWPLVGDKGAPKAHLNFTVHEHPVPSSPLPGMTVNADDTDCVLMGKYELKTPSAFSPLSEWYVKDPKSGESFIPGHQYKSLPSGKSFPERPGKPVPEEWVFKKDDLETLVAQILSDEDVREGKKKDKREIRALEALGLLVEVVAYTGTDQKKYQWGGKPNCAQIARAMEAQAGQGSGMREEKLKRLVGDALDAYQMR